MGLLFYVDIHTAYRLYMNYRCYQITLQWNIFTQIGNDAKCWLGIYRLGRRPGGDWGIRDIGYEVIFFFFKQEVVQILSYRIPRGRLRNKYNICTTHYIMICINNNTINNNTINNFRKTPHQILFFKIVMGTGRISSKFTYNLGMPRHKVSPALVQGLPTICRYRQSLNTAGCYPGSRVSWFSSVFPSRIWDINRL